VELALDDHQWVDPGLGGRRGEKGPTQRGDEARDAQDGPAPWARPATAGGT
jgi:hypothetical protein